MNQYKTITLFVVWAIVSFLPANVWSDDLSQLKQQLKSCNDASCKETIQMEAENIFNRVGKVFNDDFAEISNKISIHHCHSIIKEIFYHMDKIKDYYNYKDVFLIKKLKRLKQNRDKLDIKKIAMNDFNRLNKRVEEQYKHDLKESQDFIDDKVLRLTELCENLQRNLESIQGNLELKDKQLSYRLRSRIVELQNDKTWQAFSHNPKESKKMKEAIHLASNNSGQQLIPKLENIFSGFASSTGNTIFPDDLIIKLVRKYPINK